MKLADVTTVSTRIDRVRQSVIIIEALVRLLERADEGNLDHCASTGELLWAAQEQLGNAHMELMHLQEVQSDLKIPAPDDDERRALKEAGVSW